MLYDIWPYKCKNTGFPALYLISVRFIKLRLFRTFAISNKISGPLRVRNNGRLLCLRFGITYPTGRFYKDSWVTNHKDQAALIKSSRNISAILLGDSIIAGSLRYPNIWYKFFNENTINCGVGGDKVQNVLWRAENIPLPQSLEYVVISCGTNNLDTDDSKKIADGLFALHLPSKKEWTISKL